jgi:RIO-like serine/threonine protein kinase
MNKKRSILINLSRLRNRDRYYSVVPVTHELIKKHPLCANYSNVFIKTYRQNSLDIRRSLVFHEFEINKKLYSLFQGKHIPKCLGRGPDYIIYELISFNIINNTSMHRYALIIKALKNIKHMLYTMHNNGISYGDAHIYNFLITERGNYFLIDYERVKIPCSKIDAFFDIYNTNCNILYVYMLKFASKNIILHQLCVILISVFYRLNLRVQKFLCQ